ncbi:MAG: branched-chain amino acid ABC transporter permease [Aestuariivirga sp.]
MPIDILAQIAIGGILIGGLYALFAFGLSLIYGVARILNFSHGTLLAIAGVLASILYTALGSNPLALVAIIVGLAAGFFLFGWAFHDVLLAPLKRRNHFEASVGTVLTTVGALIIIGDVAATLAGPRPRNIPLRSDVIEIGNVLIPVSQAWMLAGITVLTIVLQLVLSRSWYGRAVRAVTQDHVGATICGVRPRAIHGITFGLGAALAAIAGVLYAMVFPVDPYAGFNLTVKAFTIIVLGGVGNLVGALAAGLFLGMAEAFTAFFWAPEWAPALSITLLLVILVAFPQGFGSVRRA